jgi:hypothetical protein
MEKEGWGRTIRPWQPLRLPAKVWAVQAAPLLSYTDFQLPFASE